MFVTQMSHLSPKMHITGIQNVLKTVPILSLNDYLFVYATIIVNVIRLEMKLLFRPLSIGNLNDLSTSKL